MWGLKSEPREWQRAAFREWQLAGNRGVVEVVTGGGKTVFAEMCMLHLANDDGMIFVILVPTLALIDQWYVSLTEDLAVDPTEIAVFSGDSRPASPNRVNLVTLNTGRTIVPRLTGSHKVFLIVDECHRAGSSVNAKAIKGSHEATLGLSATPERQYDAGFNELIAPALGQTIFSYGYNEARRDGVIAPFELVNVAVELQPDEQAEYDRLSRQIARKMSVREERGQVIDSVITALLRRRARVSGSAAMRLPVAAKLAESHTGERMLIFHEQIAPDDTLQRNLKQRGHNVGIYHSGIGPTIRRDNLRLFRQGAYDILVSCRALDEGVNVPETTVAIIVSSTASTRQIIQRLGRVLRPSPGKSKALVYTLYATPPEERRLAEESRELTGADKVTWLKGSVHQ